MRPSPDADVPPEERRVLLAIDPGNIESAYVLADMDTYAPLEHAKVENRELLSRIWKMNFQHVAVEQIASYGMAVGREVFDTCKWIGRFTQVLEGDLDMPVQEIYRKDEKMCLCGDSRAKDPNIRMALIDRFAQFDFKNGKGVKSRPDWFYGFRADEWAAYAVAVTALDIRNRRYYP